MFCENCGNKMQEGHKFCTKCGHPNSSPAQNNIPTQRPFRHSMNEKKRRFLHVAVYLPLLIIVPVVWSENSYSYYSGDSYGTAFFLSLLSLVVYVAMIRIIKVSIAYIMHGEKPDWKKEFKKTF